MATLVSNPPVCYTSLRSVEYKFAMPDIGSGDIEKFLRYRIKNVTDGVYLTDWKLYRPVANGQEITVDFYRDMFGINQFNAPPFGLPNVIFSDANIIKTVEVEYGERSVDKGNGCEIVDTTNGTTPRSDLIGGIWRPWEVQFPTTGKLLTNRPKLYVTNRNSADWLYVAGTYRINVAYYGSAGFLIGSDSWTTTETFPNSTTSIVPIGFQIAPAGTQVIKVYAKQSGPPNPATDHLCTIKGEFAACEEGNVMDIYFVNHLGGIDLMSFDCTQNKEMQVAKEYITKRYIQGQGPEKGQVATNVNRSFPQLTLRKQFDRLILPETEWLDDFVASSHAWLRMTHKNGTEFLFKINIVDSAHQTYGNEIDLSVGIRFSEELPIPI